MHDARPLSFETLLRDPLIRAVMRSDRVSVQDMVQVLASARLAIARRERVRLRQALARAAGEPVGLIRATRMRRSER